MQYKSQFMRENFPKSIISERSSVEVEYYGSTGGHGGHSANSLKDGLRDAQRIKKDIPKEEFDFTQFVGVMDYKYDEGIVVYCTDEYLRIVEAGMFDSRENYDIFINACKQNMRTGKPVTYRFV